MKLEYLAEATPSEGQHPLLLDLGLQLLLAHLLTPGRTLEPDELLLRVEAFDQPPTPFLPGQFLRLAH